MINLISTIVLTHTLPIMAMCMPSPYFVIESQANNIVHQSDIINRHGYDLYTVNRIGMSEGLSLSVTPSQFFKTANSNYSLETRSTNYLHIAKIRQSSGITDLATVVINDTSVIVYNPKTYSSEHLLNNTYYRLDTDQVKYEADTIRLDCSEFACSILADTHYTEDTTLFVIIEIKSCLDHEKKCMIYVLVIPIDLLTYKKVEMSNPYFVYRIKDEYELANDNTRICTKRRIKSLKGFSGNIQETKDDNIALLIRSCERLGTDATEDDAKILMSGCLKSYITTSGIDLNYTIEPCPVICDYLLTSKTDHSVTVIQKLKIIKIYMLGKNLVLINKDKLITLPMVDFIVYISYKDIDKPLIKFSLLYSVTNIKHIWCTGINFNELRCLSRQTYMFSSLDILYVDNSVVAITSDFMLITEDNPASAFMIKNYYVILYNTGSSYLCDKRVSQYQRIGLNISDTQEGPYLEECHELDFKNAGDLIDITNLMLDDSYDSDVHGYALLAFKNKVTGSIVVRPTLLTGIHFEIIPEFSLDGYTCHRYMKNCFEFELEFVGYLNDRHKTYEKITRTFYILNDKFTSVLPKFSSRLDIPHLHFGQAEMYLDQFFVGDLDNVRLSKLIKLQPHDKSLINPSTLSFVSTAQQFTYTLTYNEPRMAFYSIIDNSRVEFNWFMLKFNSDNTISIAFSFISQARLKYKQTSEVYPLYHTYKNLPSIDLVHNSTILGGSYLAECYQSMTAGRQLPIKRYLIAAMIGDMDSLLVADVDVEYNGPVKPRTASIDVKRFQSRRGQAYIYDRLAIAKFPVQKTENITFVRTKLSKIDDSFAVVTSHRIVIYKILEESPGKWVLQQDINLLVCTFDINMKDKTTRIEIRDFIIQQNTWIIDTVQYMADGTVLNRVYLFENVPATTSFFKIGYIELTSIGLYQFYFSASTTKAILIEKLEKRISTYSLIEHKQDLSKIGQEILARGSQDLEDYGVYTIKGIEFGRMCSGIDHKMTLLSPFNDRYFPLIATTLMNDKEYKLLLIGDLKATRHIFYNSYTLNVSDSYCTAQVPQIVTEDSLHMMPIVEIKRKTNTIRIHFFWIRQSIDLKYAQLGKCTAKEYGLESSLRLTYQDPSMKQYEDVFKVGRSNKFYIEPSIQRNLELNTTFNAIELREQGLVNTYSFECQDGVTDYEILRNDYPKFTCPNQKFSLQYRPSIVKEGHLFFDPIQFFNVNSLIRIQNNGFQRINYLFLVLQPDKLIAFVSEKSNLRYLVSVDFYLNAKESIHCHSIHSITYPTKKGEVYNISLLCSLGVSFKEIILSIDPEEVRAAYHERQTIKKSMCLDCSDTPSFVLSSKLRAALHSSNNNIVVQSSLLFARTSKYMYSFGWNTVLDMYRINTAAPETLAQIDFERITLVNSTLNYKFTSSKLISFRVTKLAPGKDDLHDRYLIVMLSSNPQSGGQLDIEWIVVSDYGGDLNLIETSGRTIGSHNFNMDDYEISYAEVVQESTRESSHINHGKNNNYYLFVIINHVAYQLSISGIMTGELTYDYGDLQAKYNFAGLCSPKSDYKIEATNKYVVVSCMPDISENMAAYLIVYPHVKPTKSSSSILLTPPLQVNLNNLGFTRKNGHFLMFVGEDGEHRIIKSSKTKLISQFRLQNRPHLALDVQNKNWNNRHLRIHMSNPYETESMDVIMRSDKLAILLEYFKNSKVEASLLVVLCLYLASVAMSFITIKIREVYFRPDTRPAFDSSHQEGIRDLTKAKTDRDLASELMLDVY